MKIAIIGGGGVRTPLLVNGLTRSDLPIDEIALFDTDRERLETIGALAASFSPAVRIAPDAGCCLSDASFVLLSIRAGGIAARARDEAIAVAHGTAGQETVGAAGFAMAMRNIPPAVAYAELVARYAPSAWIVSFTNPVGVVTQAMMAAGATRTIGICDTPTELFEEVARAIDIESRRLFFDYFGLNHLGWLREVYCDGEPQLHRVWDRPELLQRIYRAPLFDASLLASLRLLPTEYLFYYYCADAALANMKKAGLTRGDAILALNDRLFRDLAVPGADRRSIYEAYLDARNAGYMQIESGAAQPLSRSPWAELTGYDKIALSVLRAVHFDANATIPLNVPNRGAIRDLADDDVVEVPCVVNANGARPMAVGAAPADVRYLLVRVKAFERLTVMAASTGSGIDAERALAANPLVADAALAARLVAALRPW